MGYDPIGKREIPSTFVIYDTQTGTASGFQVETSVAGEQGSGKIIPYP
jgi:hypothetical protein